MKARLSFLMAVLVLFAVAAGAHTYFTTHLEENTGNAVQGIDASITFIIHGTQQTAP